MKSAQKPDHVSLTPLIGRLREGRYAMPDLQHEFGWKPWDILFEDRYANKETLTKHFGQLEDLRNAIRHSRNVDEVTGKEGEAALRWFKQVLGR